MPPSGIGTSLQTVKVLAGANQAVLRISGWNRHWQKQRSPGSWPGHAALHI